MSSFHSYDSFCRNDVPVHLHRVPNDVIVINSTQKDDISQGDLPAMDAPNRLQTVATPAYISVVYGDCDVDNDLIV